MTELRGIAWNHTRGYDPLVACSSEFRKLNPEVNIDWHVRPLKEFGDTPIEDLVLQYDLIAIDHPYSGQVHAKGLLVDLSDKISPESLRSIRENSVGPSFESYTFENCIYALPIDAAAIVAAARQDLLLNLAVMHLPKSRDELLAFYKMMPSRNSVAWPLCPTDLWCTFLTLCVQEGGRGFINDYAVDIQAGTNALQRIQQHLRLVHPESINWNPIQILERMSVDNEIVYSPYLFGYTNYARPDSTKHIVHFSNSPVNPAVDVSTILGGVGLGISSECRAVETAVEFVTFVASPDIQMGIYTREGGQPGSLQAWTNRGNNEMCCNFFVNTLKTMEEAYVRPRHPMWNCFQEQGAVLLHEGVVNNTDSANLIRQLNDLYLSVVQCR